MAKGELRLRMPAALHEALEARAAEQGVSLNQLMVALLAGGIGFRLDEIPGAPNKTAPAPKARRGG